MTIINQLRKNFKNKGLLDQALTHKSWVNEHQGIRQSNERLEFLGDAVLELMVSYELFKRFPNKDEGYLTALRANLVNTVNLSAFAKKKNLGQALFLSKGEEEEEGRKNPSILADTVEAIIGALYLDQGAKKTLKFICDNLLSDLSEKLAKPLKDPKSRLQEEVQAKGLPAPNYKVVSQTGPDHLKKFVVEVWVHNQILGKESGKNKSDAEKKAAAAALVKISQER